MHLSIAGDCDDRFFASGCVPFERHKLPGISTTKFPSFPPKMSHAREKRANVPNCILERTPARTFTGTTGWSDQIHVPIFATRTVIRVPSDPAPRFRRGHGSLGTVDDLKFPESGDKNRKSAQPDLHGNGNPDFRTRQRWPCKRLQIYLSRTGENPYLWYLRQFW